MEDQFKLRCIYVLLFLKNIFTQHGVHHFDFFNLITILIFYFLKCR
jgi:hypothetical protein